MALSTKADDDQFLSSTWQLLYRDDQVSVIYMALFSSPLRCVHQRVNFVHIDSIPFPRSL
jgi:hypothetical protein